MKQRLCKCGFPILGRYKPSNLCKSCSKLKIKEYQKNYYFEHRKFGTCKFKKVNVIKKTTKIEFKTKDGRNISFHATKIIRKTGVI